MRQISLQLLRALGWGRPCTVLWGCSGVQLWGCKSSQSHVGSPLTISKQEMLSQAQTMLQQMGIAENHQVVTACSSCSTHSPAVPVAAVPGVGRSSPADPSAGSTLVSHCPQSRGLPGPCLPLHHCQSPCRHLEKHSCSLALGSQGMAGPGAQLRAGLQHSMATLILGETCCYVHQVL